MVPTLLVALLITSVWTTAAAQDPGTVIVTPLDNAGVPAFVVETAEARERVQSPRGAEEAVEVKLAPGERLAAPAQPADPREPAEDGLPVLAGNTLVELTREQPEGMTIAGYRVYRAGGPYTVNGS